MNDFISTLQKEFERQANSNIALQQKAYMRDQFSFYGLKAPIRKEITKPFLMKQFLPEKAEMNELTTALWEKPQREFQMFGQEFVFKYVKHFEQSDMPLFEYMITTKSWWDTVDFIANKILGAYFIKFPEDIPIYVEKWLHSNNIWLQRSALLFQLKYKDRLDTDVLDHCIQHLLGSKEFFINKAIGWVLREYSRTNPIWVKNYAAQHDLHPLSEREALRLMK